MQNPKARNNASDGLQKTSPATPKSKRISKASGSESESGASTQSSKRISTERSPKSTERRSPRSPALEKKHLSKVSDLERQIAQLQEDLKKTKDQLNSSEASNWKAQQEADDAKMQLASMTAKFEDCRHQLEEFSAAEEDRLQELRKISQERDRAWQSELEAVQRQHSMDNTALSSAMVDMQRLKQQLDAVLKSEAAQLKKYETTNEELQCLKEEMAETLFLVENLKCQMRDHEKGEIQAQADLRETRMQLEMANKAIENLRSDGSKLLESLKSKVLELEESQARINQLEETLDKMQAHKTTDGEETMQNLLAIELDELKKAFKAAHVKNQEEQSELRMQIGAAEELVERMKNENKLKETDLESILNKAKAEILNLKTDLLDKETELQGIADMNKELTAKLKDAKQSSLENDTESRIEKLSAEVAELKASLMDKETDLQSISEENEILKFQVEKREEETRKKYEAAVAEAEVAKASEKDLVSRLGIVTEEADKSSRRAARASEQLEAAQAVNAEIEAELRRLRVQSDQWRKAAEAAAAVLTTGGGNGRLMDRTPSSLDTDYNSIAGKLIGSPFSDDLDDDSPKKKNGNVLRKIGGLWKKSPK